MFFSIRSALEAADPLEGLAFWSEARNWVVVVARSRLRAVPNFLEEGTNPREGLAFWKLACPWPRLHAENGLRKAPVRDPAEKVPN